jgi:hypothetical protein
LLVADRCGRLAATTSLGGPGLAVDQHVIATVATEDRGVEVEDRVEVRLQVLHPHLTDQRGNDPVTPRVRVTQLVPELDDRQALLPPCLDLVGDEVGRARKVEPLRAV